MTAKNSTSPDVTHNVNPDGSHSIGVELDGVFVPFATLEGPYVDALVDAGHSPEAEEASGTSSGAGGK